MGRRRLLGLVLGLFWFSPGAAHVGLEPPKAMPAFAPLVVDRGEVVVVTVTPRNFPGLRSLLLLYRFDEAAGWQAAWMGRSRRGSAHWTATLRKPRGAREMRLRFGCCDAASNAYLEVGGWLDESGEWLLARDLRWAEKETERSGDWWQSLDVLRVTMATSEEDLLVTMHTRARPNTALLRPSFYGVHLVYAESSRPDTVYHDLLYYCNVCPSFPTWSGAAEAGLIRQPSLQRYFQVESTDPRVNTNSQPVTPSAALEVDLGPREIRFRVPVNLLEVEPQILGASAFTFWYLEIEFPRVWAQGPQMVVRRFVPQVTDVTPLFTIAFVERRVRL